MKGLLKKASGMAQRVTSAVSGMAHSVHGNQDGRFRYRRGRGGGGLLGGIIGAVIMLVVLAVAVPELWPMVTDSSGNITAMTGTDAGTTFIKSFWPVILVLGGLGIGVGIVFAILRKMKLGKI